MSNPSLYHTLNSQLQQSQIGLTASELHGLMTGLIAGGNQDESWQVLINDFVNNGQALPSTLMTTTEIMQQSIAQSLKDGQFDFQLLLDEHSALFTQIDDLIGWVNHFLLGLGLMQPKLDKVKGEAAEAIEDLRQIVHLGYDEEDEPEALAQAFEEVVEYVRVATMLCYEEFALATTSDSHQLH